MKFSKNIFEKLLCKNPNAYANLRNLCGAKDWEKEVFLRTIKPNWTILEIGANQGYFTKLFQQLVGVGGEIHAFEPLPSTFKILENSISKGLENCILHNLGTSDQTSEVTFYLPINDHGQASMSAHDCESWKNREIKEVICDVVRLDDFKPVCALDKIDFIKIDVEGAELPSLQGAKRTIRKYKPIIFIEGCKSWMKSFGYSPTDLEAYLRVLGYSRFGVVGETLLSIASIANFLDEKEGGESFNFLVS
jgi:FkbM family methyltransferase